MRSSYRLIKFRATVVDDFTLSWPNSAAWAQGYFVNPIANIMLEVTVHTARFLQCYEINTNHIRRPPRRTQ